MNVMTKSTRFAATGAAVALAAAALVGVTGTAANAAPEVTNTYDCTTPNGLAFPVTLKTNALGIESFETIGAGASIPANLLKVTTRATMPAAAAQALGGSGVDHVELPDFAADFGSESVGVSGMVGYVADIINNGDGTVSLDLPKDDPATEEWEAGINKAFATPAAGVYDILMPGGFTINAYAADGTLIAPITCGLAADQTAQALHSIEVTKGASTASGKPVAKTLKTTTVAKMKVTVLPSGSRVPTGKVLVKEGTKTLGSAMLNDAGKATVKMGKLKKGKHTVKVVYKGDGYNAKDVSDKITFTIKRP